MKWLETTTAPRLPCKPQCSPSESRLIGVAALISQACAYSITVHGCTRVPDGFLAAVPFAPLAMVAFLQMVSTAGTVRNYYMRALEAELREHTPEDFRALTGVKPATYIELLTGHISTRRGSTPYRLIGAFIVAALLVLFEGLTIFMATGVSVGWAVAMLMVYGAASGFIGAEAVSATIRGRSLFRDLVSRLSYSPDLPTPTRSGSGDRQRSQFASVLIPRARFDETIKRAFIPITFILAAAALGNWRTVDYAEALVVWGTYEFLLYDARYQWNDIRDFEEDGINRRTDRLPHGQPPGSAQALRQDAVTIRLAVLAVLGRVLLALLLCAFFTNGGLHGQGWVVAAALSGAVLATATVYEALRARGSVWPVWLWVGAGYGVRGAIGVALGGYGVTSPEVVLAFIALAGFGTMSVTLTWTLQTMARCSGPRSRATVHGATPPHLVSLLQFAGVRTVASDPSPVSDAEGASWKVERTADPRSPAPWEVSMLLACATGAPLGVLLAERDHHVGAVLLAGVIALVASGALLLRRGWRWILGTLGLVVVPIIISLAIARQPSVLLAGVPGLIFVGIYANLRSVTFETLTPDFMRLGRWLLGIVWILIVGRRTAAYLAGDGHSQLRKHDLSAANPPRRRRQ